MADSMQITRASVDISTNVHEPKAVGVGADSNSFTVTVNKKVAYALGLVVVVVLGALGVASWTICLFFVSYNYSSNWYRTTCRSKPKKKGSNLHTINAVRVPPKCTKCTKMCPKTISPVFWPFKRGIFCPDQGTSREGTVERYLQKLYPLCF